MKIEDLTIKQLRELHNKELYVINKGKKHVKDEKILINETDLKKEYCIFPIYREEWNYEKLYLREIRFLIYEQDNDVIFYNECDRYNDERDIYLNIDKIYIFEKEKEAIDFISILNEPIYDIHIYSTGKYYREVRHKYYCKHCKVEEYGNWYIEQSTSQVIYKNGKIHM